MVKYEALDLSRNIDHSITTDSRSAGTGVCAYTDSSWVYPASWDGQAPYFLHLTD